MEKADDIYYTVENESEALYKDKGSKFLVFAYHIEDEEQIRERLEVLRKRYYDATHHCYAWRLGAKGESFRANDDGEPSSTAGKPILGQLLSREVTNTLIVVVRYFGGTKLGVSGLISAYKESAATVLEQATIIQRSVDAVFEIQFGYLVMNDIMKIIKEEQPAILKQNFDNMCRMTLGIRATKESVLFEKLSKVEGANIEMTGYK